MKKYAALLLGINVGGNRKVAMSELKKMMEGLDFQNVKTLLNSGNVVFDAIETDDLSLKDKIEVQLRKTFGFEISIILLSFKELQDLIAKDPFKHIKITRNTRFYITFLPDNTPAAFKIPCELEEPGFRILQGGSNIVISVLELSEHYKTTDVMKILTREFGKKITTRNWNTVKKIARL